MYVSSMMSVSASLLARKQTKPLIAEHGDDDVMMQVVNSQVERRVVVGVLERDVTLPL